MDLSDTSGGAAGSTAVTGASLFQGWVLPFEALSVLLLAALVGAIVLSRKAAADGRPAGKAALGKQPPGKSVPTRQSRQSAGKTTPAERPTGNATPDENPETPEQPSRKEGAR
jgi:NADH-quinone oxidoreductase subunit J